MRCLRARAVTYRTIFEELKQNRQDVAFSLHRVRTHVNIFSPLHVAILRRVLILPLFYFPYTYSTHPI